MPFIHPPFVHAQELLNSKTRYFRFAKDEDLPHIANCVTAIRFVVQRCFAFNMPRVFIYNMPEVLCKYGWERIHVDTPQVGDLLFISKKLGKASHVAMVIDEGKIFHCHHPIGAEIQDANAFFKKYRYFHAE